MSILSHFSCVFVTLWTVAQQAPQSKGFSRQEYWTGLPCHPPGDLPDPGIKCVSPVSPALQAVLYPLSHWVSSYIFIGHSFWYAFPLWFSTDIEYSSLCYKVGPCCLSILYILSLHLLVSDSQSFLLRNSLPLGNHMSVLYVWESVFFFLSGLLHLLWNKVHC